MSLTREQLEACDKETLIRMYLRRVEGEASAALALKLDGEAYRELLADKCGDICGEQTDKSRLTESKEASAGNWLGTNK